MAAYYNENDPKTAAWLRELIKARLIADGEVDTRSIIDVQPADLAGFVQCHFFAGIGGWSQGLRLAGWRDEWPAWTGSCPCQPWSSAGKGAAASDPRHLWPAWFRLIQERCPGRIFGEQVASADGRAWLDVVCDDLEACNYAVGPVDFPACGIAAPFRRSRLWFVADSGRAGLPERSALQRSARTPPAPSAWREFERVHGEDAWARWDAESEVRVFAYGLSNVGGRLRGFGNSVSPYHAAEVIAAYMELSDDR